MCHNEGQVDYVLYIHDDISNKDMMEGITIY